MKPLTVATFLAISLLTSAAFGEGAPAPVAVYMTFDGQSSTRAVDAMKQEVESLTSRSGFNLTWRALPAAAFDDTAADLVVVKFRGKCHMEGIQLLFSELGPEPENGVLGSTKVVDGHVLPFSELECDRIRRSIAPLTIGNSRDEREALMGRAMGRVLAHELFHIFAKTTEHSHTGVAKISHSRKDLIAERFDFNPKDSKRIQRR